jgi:hypothetical protein
MRALPPGHGFTVPENLFRKITDEERADWQTRFSGVRGFRRNRWLAGRYSADARNCGSEGDSFGVWCRHRTRVAANEGVPEMPVVLPSRSTPIRSYSAIALFLVVYVGVLFVIFAPRDMIAVESGVAFYGAED